MSDLVDKADARDAVAKAHDVYAAAREEYRKKVSEQAARIEALEAALREIAGLGVICASDMAIIALRDDRAALEEKS